MCLDPSQGPGRSERRPHVQYLRVRYTGKRPQAALRSARLHCVGFEMALRYSVARIALELYQLSLLAICAHSPRHKGWEAAISDCLGHNSLHLSFEMVLSNHVAQVADGTLVTFQDGYGPLLSSTSWLGSTHVGHSKTQSASPRF